MAAADSESERVDLSTMRRIVFHDHADVRAAFSAALPSEIEEAIACLTTAYSAFQDLQRTVLLDERSATAHMFLHTALNSLVSALHLLISGFLAPAGNQMRQFGEALAMAMLCAEPTNGTFESYSSLGERYPFHKAVGRVGNAGIRKKLGITADGWGAFQRITGFYDRFSHASTFSVAGHIVFDKPGSVVLAGEYDPGKRFIYEVELRRIHSAAQRALTAVHIVEQHSQPDP